MYFECMMCQSLMGQRKRSPLQGDCCIQTRSKSPTHSHWWYYYSGKGMSASKPTSSENTKDSNTELQVFSSVGRTFLLFVLNLQTYWNSIINFVIVSAYFCIVNALIASLLQLRRCLPAILDDNSHHPQIAGWTCGRYGHYCDILNGDVC